MTISNNYGINSGAAGLSLSGNLSDGNGLVAYFSPLDISGLKLWLDAADKSTITHSLNSVSQWNDKSGNGRHVTQGTGANQPTTNTRTVNGLNVIDFDGSNDYMVSASFTALTQPYTVIAVLKLDQTSAAKGVNQTYVDGILTTNRAVIYGVTAPVETRVYAGASVVAGAETTNLTCFTFTPNGASSTVRINGGSAVTGNAGTHTLTGVTIGARFNFAENTDAVFCEYLVYDTSLSNVDLNRVGNYLARKWGFVWTNV